MFGKSFNFLLESLDRWQWWRCLCYLLPLPLLLSWFCYCSCLNCCIRFHFVVAWSQCQQFYLGSIAEAQMSHKSIARVCVCVFFIWNSQTMHAMCNNIASFNGISIGVVHAFRSIRMHLNTLSDAVFEHTTYAIINQITRHEFIGKRFAMHAHYIIMLFEKCLKLPIVLALHLCWFDAFIMSYIRSLCEFVSTKPPPFTVHTFWYKRRMRHKIPIIKEWWVHLNKVQKYFIFTRYSFHQFGRARLLLKMNLKKFSSLHVVHNTHTMPAIFSSWNYLFHMHSFAENQGIIQRISDQISGKIFCTFKMKISETDNEKLSQKI